MGQFEEIEKIPAAIKKKLHKAGSEFAMRQVEILRIVQKAVKNRHK